MTTDVKAMTIQDLITEYWATLKTCVAPVDPQTEFRLYELRIEIAKRD